VPSLHLAVAPVGSVFAAFPDKVGAAVAEGAAAVGADCAAGAGDAGAGAAPGALLAAVPPDLSTPPW
jgi:hypothetical protein